MFRDSLNSHKAMLTLDASASPHDVTARMRDVSEVRVSLYTECCAVYSRCVSRANAAINRALGFSSSHSDAHLQREATLATVAVVFESNPTHEWERHRQHTADFEGIKRDCQLQTALTLCSVNILGRGGDARRWSRTGMRAACVQAEATQQHARFTRMRANRRRSVTNQSASRLQREG